MLRLIHHEVIQDKSLYFDSESSQRLCYNFTMNCRADVTVKLCNTKTKLRNSVVFALCSNSLVAYINTGLKGVILLRKSNDIWSSVNVKAEAIYGKH